VSSSYTPSAPGYLLAIVVSVLALPVEIMVVSFATSDPGTLVSGGDLVAPLLGLTLWTAIPAAVIGPIGALLVHGWCRDDPHQSKHVCAAFCAGIIVPSAFAVPFAFMHGPAVVIAVVGLSLPVGVAGAIGRAAVIPMVPAHRNATVDQEVVR
jgi:hypothetical protein